ncbi:effector-associated constant component EACC1 [Rhizohabitans arisaemae]|uniref:effector-associated constant component EACC1 n=1 Tax=Rhizohabitans arisaemae TaxID=2720610 RepID=UPI0024B25070|nr:hypothetical protein [Rhizohabitans arisaemae]
MELRISIEDGDDDALAGLYRRLARDPDLTYRTRISLISAPPSPGEQGGAFEAVTAVLDNVIALSGLVVAVLAYRQARRRGDRPGTVRFELNGAVVTIEPGAETSADQVVDALTEDGPRPGEDAGRP